LHINTSRLASSGIYSASNTLLLTFYTSNIIPTTSLIAATAATQ
jgi:hypothetical protein